MSRYFLTLTLLAILFIPTAFADEPTQISNSQNDSIDPAIAIGGSDIYVAWDDQSGPNSSVILFSKSTDGGATFSTPKTIISNQSGESIAPFIVTDGATIYITWTFRTPLNVSGDSFVGNAEVLFSKSTDGGETFSTPKKISNAPAYSQVSEMAIDGQNVFLTWQTVTWAGKFYENLEVYFSKSTDGGETFSEPQNISNNESFSQRPTIATNGTDVFISWSDEYMGEGVIFFSKSTDGGETFSEPQSISNHMEYSVGPSIVTDGSNIYITWFYHLEGKENHEILFSKSTDGGRTFSEPKNISNTSGYSSTPSIVTNGKSIFVAWADDQTASRSILFSKSTDGGETFSEPQRISSSTGFSDHPDIVTNGKYIYDVWSWKQHVEGGDGSKIFFSKLPVSESAPGDVSNMPENANSASLEQHVANSTDKTFVKKIKWLDENGADYTVGGIGVIRLDNSDLNVNKTLLDIPTVHVWSDTDPKGIPVDVIETGVDTGVFYADILLSGTESAHLQLHVSDGDAITASFDDYSDEPLADTARITSKYLPPLQQLASGTPEDEIQCEDGMVLAHKASSGDPLCLKPESYEKLKERNWIQ